MNTIQHTPQTNNERAQNRESAQTKQLQLDGETCRIIEIGRESASVFTDTETHQLHIYHILVDAADDLRTGFESGRIKIDVGNGYRQLPVDRILQIEEHPLMIEGRRTPITEWIVAVGGHELARKAMWNELPRRVEQELAYRCRPASYIDELS